jgi:kumamolisin
MAQMRENMVAVPKTERRVAANAKVVGDADPGHRINVTVYLRKSLKAKATAALKLLETALPKDRKYLSEKEVAATFGADPDDIAKVEAFAKSQGLLVLETHQARRSVLLSGTVAQFNSAFGIQLKQYEAPTGHFRGREGSVHVPADLSGVVEAVFGLDNRPFGRAHLRRPKEARAVAGDGLPDNTYFPPELAKIYNFPDGTTGSGQCIGIFVFNDQGGGYRIDALQKYFNTVLVPPVPIPPITNVVVHGKGNDPHFTPAGDATADSTGEVMLDIQVAGSVAPGAKIVMYFTDFTKQGWVDAIKQAVHDTVNNPSVLSISYGNPEDDSQGFFPTEDMVKIISDTLETAKAKGITICVASGDDGSTDQDTDGNPHTDFPASSPSVLACGGTRLESSNGRRTSETVWNNDTGAGGGGVSTVFPLPDYQTNAGVPSPQVPSGGRGVPDVSGLADPQTGVQIVDVNGGIDKRFPTGGTSATAPLWAALIARINEGLGARTGFLNTVLYTRFSQGVLFDVTQGNNGAFSAGSGWDACTGLGSPDGQKLLDALSGKPSTQA